MKNVSKQCNSCYLLTTYIITELTEHLLIEFLFQFSVIRRVDDFKKYKKDNDIHELMPILPLLCTGVVFSSMFFGLRGMAYLPVESLTTGGALWFTDLTAIDPYIILPLLTSASLFVNFKLGGDGVDRLPPPVRKIMELIPFLMPIFKILWRSPLNVI